MERFTTGKEAKVKTKVLYWENVCDRVSLYGFQQIVVEPTREGVTTASLEYDEASSAPTIVAVRLKEQNLAVRSGDPRRFCKATVKVPSQASVSIRNIYNVEAEVSARLQSLSLHVRDGSVQCTNTVEQAVVFVEGDAQVLFREVAGFGQCYFQIFPNGTGTIRVESGYMIKPEIALSSGVFVCGAVISEATISCSKEGRVELSPVA